jgi:hypothetical protein
MKPGARLGSVSKGASLYRLPPSRLRSFVIHFLPLVRIAPKSTLF